MTKEEAEKEIRYIFTKEWADGIIKALKQEPCEDAVSRKAVLEVIDDCNSDGLKGIFCSYDDGERFKGYIKDLSPVLPQPKTGHCKDCKWWKDSDGLYRRGGHAESQCPINRREVLEGDGYCYMFEPPERSDNG